MDREAAADAGGSRIFQAAGSIVYRFASGLRTTVARNQARVLGRPVDDPFVRANTREAFRRYARYWFDSFAIEEWDAADVLDAFSWDGDEHLLRFPGRGERDHRGAAAPRELGRERAGDGR